MDELQLDLLLPYCENEKFSFLVVQVLAIGLHGNSGIGTLQILAKIRMKLSRHKQLIMPLSPW